ncbi:MAG: glycosyltransferase family 2 protein [Bacteroidales bacterium]
MQELVSVITPTYNSKKYIRDAIDSVLSQSYANLELILIDDASSDGTREVLKEYESSDSRVRIILNNQNSGAGISRNKGIKAARGTYIAFLDSDDAWDRNKLASQISFMQTHGYTFSYTKYAYMNESGCVIRKRNLAPNSCGYLRLLLQDCIGCSTVVINVEQLGKAYMPELRNRQDWALWLTYIKRAGRAHGMNKSFTNYRMMKGSISSNKFRLFRFHWKVYHEIEQYGVFVSSLLFLINIVLISYYSVFNKILVRRV